MQSSALRNIPPAKQRTGTRPRTPCRQRTFQINVFGRQFNKLDTKPVDRHNRNAFVNGKYLTTQFATVFCLSTHIKLSDETHKQVITQFKCHCNSTLKLIPFPQIELTNFVAHYRADARHQRHNKQSTIRHSVLNVLRSLSLENYCNITRSECTRELAGDNHTCKTVSHTTTVSFSVEHAT